MLNILVVDDMKILRDCLKLAIEKNNEFNVIGCACDGAEAIHMCRELKPDLVLMDIMMPKLSGIEATRIIKQEFPGIKILILTSTDDSEDIAHAMECGADGYVLKDIGGEELFAAIKGVHMGLNFVHLNAYNAAKALPCKDNDKSAALTKRETTVIELIAKGMTNEEIASNLKISEGRVRNIVTSLISKLMLKNRTQLAVYAVTHDSYECQP